MRKFTKTVLGIISLCLIFFALSACQEDVYPDLERNELETEIIVDLKGETEDGDEDEGIIPE